MPPVETKGLVQDIVERVTIAADRIEIRLSRAKVAAALEAEGASQRPDIDPITLSIEAKLRRVGKGKRLVIANGAEAEVNAGFVELIKDAFTIRIQRQRRGDKRTPWNEQVAANLPHSIVLFGA
jgi:site-specific DNA recombinase